MTRESEPSRRRRRQAIEKARRRLLAFSVMLLKRYGVGNDRAHMDLEELVQVGLVAIAKHFGEFEVGEDEATEAELEALGKQLAAYGMSAIKNHVVDVFRQADLARDRMYEVENLTAPWVGSAEDKFLVQEALAAAGKDKRVGRLVTLIADRGVIQQRLIAQELGCSDRTVRNLHGYAKKRFGF
jgi:DNA-directed RNA polymerase specialized sigma24 family protein